MEGAPINIAEPAALPKLFVTLNSASNKFSSLIGFLRNRFVYSFILLIVILVLIDRFANPTHLPWKPLDIDAPIGLATKSKIALIADAPSDICLGKLASAKALTYVQVLPKHEGKTCGWDVAATMTQANGTRFKPRTVTTQCSLMIAGYIWLDSVNSAAQKRLGSKLAKVHHIGTYSCRRQRGNGSGAWSEHSFANAWDITGFELKDGRVISVLKDWKKTQTKESKARAKFLRDAHKSACRIFHVTLSPDFNAAHKDHFHLDQGPSSTCR